MRNVKEVAAHGSETKQSTHHKLATDAICSHVADISEAEAPPPIARLQRLGHKYHPIAARSREPFEVKITQLLANLDLSAISRHAVLFGLMKACIFVGKVWCRNLWLPIVSIN